jgi:hypothetical protein
MEIIEIECGSCHEVMAISAEHMGTQVHCPHCQAVVQAPQEEASAPPSGEEKESIFAEPEQDDVFGAEPQRPMVELPPDAEKRQESPVPNLSLDAPSGPTRQSNAQSDGLKTQHEPQPAAAPPEEEEAPLTPSLARVAHKSSVLLPSLLIFLVPYSIVATVFIVLLLINRPSSSESLERFDRLPDPEPPAKDKKGPPRKITRLPHDGPLPQNLIARLGETLTVGDVQFTPIEVRRTFHNELVLRFRVKNASTEYAFQPISTAFVDINIIPTPYTYLHLKDENDSQRTLRVYGGVLAHQDLRGLPKLRSAGELKPGEEEFVELTTEKKTPDGLTAAKGPLLWRVQLRRGLVDINGRSYSATAVLAVEFRSADIKLEKSAFGDA